MAAGYAVSSYPTAADFTAVVQPVGASCSTSDCLTWTAWSYCSASRQARPSFR